MKHLCLGALLALPLVSGCLGVVALGRTPYDLDGQRYYIKAEYSDEGRVFKVEDSTGKTVEETGGYPGPLAKRLESEGKRLPTQSATTASENWNDDNHGGDGY